MIKYKIYFFFKYSYELWLEEIFFISFLTLIGHFASEIDSILND